MAANQLGVNRFDHFIHREVPRLGGHLRKEHHLKQQVAQLVFQSGEILIVDRLDHFISLFQQVGLDGLEGLLAVPRAAPRRAQPPHQFH